VKWETGVENGTKAVCCGGYWGCTSGKGGGLIKVGVSVEGMEDTAKIRGKGCVDEWIIPGGCKGRESGEEGGEEESKVGAKGM